MNTKLQEIYFRFPKLKEIYENLMRYYDDEKFLNEVINNCLETSNILKYFHDTGWVEIVFGSNKKHTRYFTVEYHIGRRGMFFMARARVIDKEQINTFKSPETFDWWRLRLDTEYTGTIGFDL